MISIDIVEIPNEMYATLGSILQKWPQSLPISMVISELYFHTFDIMSNITDVPIFLGKLIF